MINQEVGRLFILGAEACTPVDRNRWWLSECPLLRVKRQTEFVPATDELLLRSCQLDYCLGAEAGGDVGVVAGGVGVFVGDVVGGAEALVGGALVSDRKYQPSRRTTITATAMTMMLRWFISKPRSQEGFIVRD